MTGRPVGRASTGEVQLTAWVLGLAAALALPLTAALAQGPTVALGRVQADREAARTTAALLARAVAPARWELSIQVATQPKPAALLTAVDLVTWAASMGKAAQVKPVALLTAAA